MPIAVVPFGWTGTLRRIAEVLPGAERRQESSDDGHVVIDTPIPTQSDPRILVAVVKAMVRDLNFPVGILVAPIVRDPDGMAMSSRNRYLSAKYDCLYSR